MKMIFESHYQNESSGFNDVAYLCKELLRSAVTDEYADMIANEIEKYVAEDIAVSSDEDWNDDDLRLAIGRAILKKFGVSV